ncbi:MAG: ATP-binding cassette domain-containing protein [bacterium]
MIELHDVCYAVKGEYILEDINLTVESGNFVSIVGPSGAGKSTLLNLMHMKIFPVSGYLRMIDYDISNVCPKHIPLLRRKVGMVYQDFKLLEDRDAYENVAFALWATGVKRKKIKRRVLYVLAEVGLSHKRYSLVTKLSGGEQQRISIARALANEPYILLADEPTGNLDPETSSEIIELLKKINRKGTAVIMATHKSDIVSTLPGKTYRIDQGRMVE